ncbi:hypothetical protein [Amycolatopsis sp. GM8]|uniref:hypothetical protein n=1 Tax=Amycolatopsis sp. GM8 TaxID=2896530 RepID=UPI001F32F047|nr:hypothetical protein [Amycolatopsis sp. GM8]
MGAVVVIGGGVTAIVLTTGRSHVDAGSIPRTSYPSPAGLSTGPVASGRPSSAGGGGAGKATPEALQAAIADAYNNRDADAFPALSCDPTSDADLKDLRDTMSRVPAAVRYAPSGPPQVNGSTGTLTYAVTAPGAQTKTFDMPITKSGGNWCIPS